MKSKKIIYQVTPYYPPHLGGMEQYVETVTKKLKNKGYSVNVITSAIGQTKKLSGVTALPAWEIAHTPVMPALLLKLFTISKNSIIHLHVAQAFVPEIVSLVCRIRGIPYIAHVHIEVGPSGSLGWLLPIYKKIFLTSVLHHAKKIIVLNTTQKEKFLNKYNLIQKQIAILPNAVDEVFFQPKQIVKKKIIHLLFVGRLSVQKNILKLLAILPFIQHNFELHIVGSGELTNEVQKKVAQMKIPIKLHGRIDQQALLTVYKNSDIFILPSEREGFPFVLLEAMAAGLPVIANKIPEIQEIAAKEVIYIHIDEPKKSAKIIDNLIADIELQQKLSHDGRSLAKQYNWNTHLEQLETIYD